ncbi:MAG: hypothetical protein PHY13_10495 [Clostridia bacterium]|nr:hypothetical protein [Clostridia bacterium]
MDNNTRALNILNYKDADRMPAVHFGYWKELLVEWVEKGHIKKEDMENVGDGNVADYRLNEKLGWDFNWHTTRRGAASLRPFFKPEVLEELPDGSRKVLTGWGVIEIEKPGVVSISGECDYTLKDRKAYEELYKPRLQFAEERVNPEYFNNNDWDKIDAPIGLEIGSVAGDVRNMLTVMGMSYMIYDDYELLDEIVSDYAELQYQVAKYTLEVSKFKFDFAHYWEDICYKNGPLFSPNVLEDLCAKHYKKRNDLVKSYGIDIVSLDCDGCIDQMIPIWLENGVNTMFPIEVGVWDASIAPWREKYGRELRGVGGMNKHVLSYDKQAVDKEIERLKPLIALGGYIPCPDHRLPPGTKFELVQYYTEKIKTVKI